MIEKTKGKNHKTESIVPDSAEIPCANDVLSRHKNNPTIALFEALKNAKSIDEIVKSRSQLVEKYPLEKLLIEAETMQDMCLRNNDFKNALSALNTRIRYLYKTADNEENSKEIYDTDEIAAVIRRIKNGK